ncbi:MAG: hypothetical protein IPL83_09865 [Bdellovibrionales bacterium]|nr:hypothetical protein [Bdellovibrionales bacterium]
MNRNLLSDYISRLALQGELTKWSVAVMSKARHENEHILDLGGNGLKVTPVERRQSPRYSGDRYDRLKNISIMSEELIDLGDILKTDRVADYISKNGLKPTIIRNQSRPKERGLLLIYPIYTNHDKTLAERELLKVDKKLFPIISDSKELFAVTFVFPPTKVEAFGCEYVENATVGRGEA